MRIKTRMFLSIISISAIILFVTLFTGCTSSTTQTSTAQSSKGRFSEILKLLPASAKNTKGFDILDYETWLKVNDISLYDAANHKISIDNLFKTLISKDKSGQLVGSFGAGSHYSGWDSFMANTTITDEYVGYDFTDIQAEINNLSYGAYSKSVPWIAIKGKFNPQATQQAFSLHKDWNPRLIEAYSSQAYQGFTIHSWGDNARDMSWSRKPPHIDITGRALPLAITDKDLLLSDTVNDVKTMIDASQGITPSLADVPEYSLLAQGLDKLGAVCAEFADESLAPGNEATDYKAFKLRLKKFLTAGTGAGKDEKGIYLALVIVHDSPETAAQNVSLLQQIIETRIDTKYGVDWKHNWKELITDADIKTDGKVLSAKLYTNHNLWVISDNSLLLHDQ